MSLQDKDKSFLDQAEAMFTSKPLVALAFSGIGFVVGVLSGVAF